MFKKILIANRGEIASRIIRTCKKMGITAVAVYSEADTGAPFVQEADEAYCIGGPRPQDSYNNGDALIAAAKEAGCEAIHPGYGFLSENPEFAEKCQLEGILFIGPNPEVIRMMGKKIESRHAMEAAGLPVVPGISFALKDVDDAIEQAKAIGYPIMLKASAGGGGIGMGAVHSEEELMKSFHGQQKRAQTFFNNGDMFMEKLIEQPRHIEIQVLFDSFGNGVYIGERECSIQRRNQKVIEEAPSPIVTEELRKKMGEAAVKAAKSIGYANAGTFEFMMDNNGDYYFLEMNTRLQVEHPVTEGVSGLDLVEQQIRIANGEELPFSQEDITLSGHSIEARIYAEDPVTFFPSPGTITRFSVPDGEGVRNDVGVKSGYTVTPFYDGMIAKLVVTGENRNQCIQRMEQALNQYHVEGVKTNISMVQEIIGHGEFRGGNTHTGFVDTYYTNKERGTVK
ncbi:acetyl/propionyl/methylcrotonyl-CoA carboxylase subunit alpha [Bacillus sp. 1P06AnD]|uniref:acetyl-CoA carboxylase biotin carboxylase subunit n=1 Tax=Bacillus sp. 1P06AnD TaxID=3132208 RepID=UPI0039A04585